MGYKIWKRFLSSNIEQNLLELAGRGYRSSESFYDSMDAAVDDMLKCIQEEVRNGIKYSIFGHSMGSIIAYELYYRLLDIGMHLPVHVFFSGRIAPTDTTSYDNTYMLPDEDFKNELIRIGGTPEDIFHNNELANYFLPIIKADYKMIGKHAYHKKNPEMECDISILNGKNDITAEIDKMDLWKETTNKTCSFYYFNGGHFYLNSYVNEITLIINKTIGKYTGEVERWTIKSGC